MECVGYHLNYQNHTIWRRFCPFCRQYPLPDRYIAHIRECRDSRLNASYLNTNAWGLNYQEAHETFRGYLQEKLGPMNDPYRGPTMCADGPVREPNAGYNFKLEQSVKDYAGLPFG